jgi:hypothetical protein
MNFTSIIADCIFCDVSYFSVFWWILLVIAAVIGLALSIYEIYSLFHKKTFLDKPACVTISVCHSIVFATIVSYGLLSRYDSINGVGLTPVLLATLIAVVYFAVLKLYKHTVKSHLFSLIILSVIGFIFWLFSNS